MASTPCPKEGRTCKTKALPPPILPFAFWAISSAENGSKKRVGRAENVKVVLNRVPKAASGLPGVILAPDCPSHLRRKAKAVHQGIFRALYADVRHGSAWPLGCWRRSAHRQTRASGTTTRNPPAESMGGYRGATPSPCGPCHKRSLFWFGCSTCHILSFIRPHSSPVPVQGRGHPWTGAALAA